QDRTPLRELKSSFEKVLHRPVAEGGYGRQSTPGVGDIALAKHSMPPVKDGDVVIAAITSCTNTSNPGVMLAAGLVAKKAVALDLKAKPWVKTSLTPGSLVVSRYLEAGGYQDALDRLGFNVAGYSCATCVGAS